MDSPKSATLSTSNKTATRPVLSPTRSFSFRNTSTSLGTRIKCRFHGHEDNGVTNICLYKDCDTSDRLSCSKCGSLHSAHQNYVLKIDEITGFYKNLKGRAPHETVTGWPASEDAIAIQD